MDESMKVTAKDIRDLAEAYSLLPHTPIRLKMEETLALAIDEYKKQFDVEEVEETEED